LKACAVICGFCFDQHHPTQGARLKVLSTKNIGVDRLKILVYAPPGSGKTTLAKTINEPTLVISAEAGLLVLKDADIDVVDITTDDNGQLIPKESRIKRLTEAYSYLLKPESQAKYKWVFIDSLTEIGQNLVEQLQKEHPDRKDALVLWGEYSKNMRSIIKALRDLPHYNVVMTALSERDKDENGVYTTGVALNGKISQALPGFFDEVFYYDLRKDSEGKVVRRLLTQATDTVVAKDRSGMLKQFEEPNLNQIAKKIKGGK
jgi:phage nucleotide-binding protein